MAFSQAAMSAFLPQGPGWLPTWQLIVAVTAALNSVSNIFSLTFSRKLYKDAFVNPVQARTFAIWTLTAAVVRFYAAYNIHNKLIYDMALLTYLFAAFHFGTEILIYRTTRLGFPVLSPVIVASSSLIWMLTQYDFYVHP